MAELMQSADAPLMRFFNERRVHTIHKGVVRPQKDTAMVTGSTVPGVAPRQQVMLWRFEGTAEFSGSERRRRTVSRCGTWRFCAGWSGIGS